MAACKILVALLPASLPVIRAWLRRFDAFETYEVHFTLFCFLSVVRYRPYSVSVQTDVLSLLREYLLEVKSESGGAAWMAGDLLGEHWDGAALPVLKEAARAGRYAAGRLGALHGLVHQLGKMPAANRDNLTALVKAFARADPSKRVRKYVRVALCRPGILTAM